MPAAIDRVRRKLEQTARSRRYGKKRSNRYVYGTLTKRLGWRPGKRATKRRHG